jgi:DNA-directed RNA polymerase subunit RPC12/RpoP
MGTPDGCRRGRGCTPVELTRDALTAPAGVSYDSVFEGVETKGLSVEEEALIAWQDVLDMVVNGRPNEVACPYCNHRPLTIEEIEQSTRISCSKCGKFIQGRFTH